MRSENIANDPPVTGAIGHAAVAACIERNQADGADGHSLSCSGASRSQRSSAPAGADRSVSRRIGTFDLDQPAARRSPYRGQPFEVSHMRATTYSPVAKFLHWLIVALIAIQLALGWLMPEARHAVPPDSLNNWHLSFGIVILAVIVIRFAWRAFVGPPLPEPGPRWALLAVVALHVAAALGHHFVLRDNVLRRMLPGRAAGRH
jgi:hypothetical protein